MMETKVELTEVEFEILPEEIKVQFVDYADTNVVRALLNGEAILVPFNTAIHRMYRFARSKGYVLHKRKSTDGLVLWLEKADSK